MLSQEVKTVSKWVVDFGEQIDNAFANGWQTKTDLPKFIDDFFAAPGMVNALPAAWAQFEAGLSDEDNAEFVANIKNELDIPHKRAEEIAEGIVQWLAATYKFYKLFNKKADLTRRPA